MLDRLSAYLAPLATLAVFLAGVAYTTFVDPDMYHGLALARESLAAGHLLIDDIFAYTPTVSPVVHHEWALGTIDQLNAKRLFQMLHRLADGALRQMMSGRSSGKATLLGNGTEEFERAKIQSWPSPIRNANNADFCLKSD